MIIENRDGITERNNSDAVIDKLDIIIDRLDKIVSFFDTNDIPVKNYKNSVFDGNTLKEARLSQALSVTDVAEYLGVTKQLIYLYEKNKCKPKAKYARLLGDLLDFDYMEYLTS